MISLLTDKPITSPLQTFVGSLTQNQVDDASTDTLESLKCCSYNERIVPITSDLLCLNSFHKIGMSLKSINQLDQSKDSIFASNLGRIVPVLKIENVVQLRNFTSFAQLVLIVTNTSTLVSELQSITRGLKKIPRISVFLPECNNETLLLTIKQLKKFNASILINHASIGFEFAPLGTLDPLAPADIVDNLGPTTTGDTGGTVGTRDTTGSRDNNASKHPSLTQIDIGRAIAACGDSDRPDSLITTIVCDQTGVCLGLVYSSAESISESVRTLSGVYQSRKRGLWYKGATSGAVQKLLSIDYDCDCDCLKFTVAQSGQGFCHLGRRSCFGESKGLRALVDTLSSRLLSSPQGSYTKRLFTEDKLLSSKIIEEAHELVEAEEAEHVANEAADLIYFVLTKCVSAGVSLDQIESILDKRALKVSNRRPGDAKRKYTEMLIGMNGEKDAGTSIQAPIIDGPVDETLRMNKADASTPQSKNGADDALVKLNEYDFSLISTNQKQQLLQRPIMKTIDIMSRVEPIMKQVRAQGDKALIELTEKFDRVTLDTVIMKQPFPPEMMDIKPEIKEAIDVAFSNILKFHMAQQTDPIQVETCPGIICSRFSRPIQNVGLYIPGGTAVLPSTALMLGIPALVAGCENIVFATPPRLDGSICPEVVYVAHKVGAKMIVKAGGAQAIASMAYGTESVLKVDKICGPGNQYVTAAKMLAQNDTSSLVSIDMPAGPSELLVIADDTCNPAYVVSDLLSQAEHGPDSQVVLLAVNLSTEKMQSIRRELVVQTDALPRRDIVRQSVKHSHFIKFSNLQEALSYSNEYAPEHLILHLLNAQETLPSIKNAGSVFIGSYATESLGDYASGTNHTLPTYGYARMYSGVNLDTFCKYLTAQNVSEEGLKHIGKHVVNLAHVEGLHAHARAVQIRLDDLAEK